MMNVTINGNHLEMYDSIDELPFSRFQEFNRALLIDTGLGSDFAAFDRHIEMARRYNADGKQQQVEQALLNLRQSLSFAMEKISPESQAFVCLIHRMNGREIDNFSPDNITRVIKELSRKGLTVAKIRGILETIKKKLTPSWMSFSQN